ncbi:MAG: SIMPL domain-containing protein [Actinomycetota bacterium]|nr:SIMPL domain-containing protein [Actinomycetota bacterium]
MKLIKILAVAVGAGALALVLALEWPGSAHSAAPERGNGITVTGTGSVKAAPDQAQFSFGVSSDATTGSAALAANADKMDRILAALRRAGTARGDIRTDGVSVGPRYSDKGERTAGFTARNSVSVTVRDVKQAGPLVDAVTAAGATDVYGPSFGRESRAALYREALRKAVADARDKAGTLAAATGVSMGRVTRVEEGQRPNYDVYPGPVALESAKTPIEPGTEEIQASVTVTFAIA